jgi:Rho termination factor, N-terminal domain
VPTNSDPQSPLLSAVRESQAAVIDVLRAWADIGQQLTRDLRLPVARIDLNEAVDRVFDVAEQTLAVQRELALTVAGVASRQLDAAADTAVEAADTAVEAADTAVEAAEAKVEAPKAEPPRRERGKPDRRTYEDRSIEELRERARELDIEGRSAMSKDELIAALRKHSR